MTIHRAPLEPTSDRVPCCGALLVDLNPVTDPLTRVARDVTCKADELADLEMSPVLAALVDSVRGPRREPLIARLREIKASKRTTAEAANSLLEAAGLPAQFADEDDVPHGEPGHQCIPPEVLMQVQDSLGNVLQIVQGHKQTLEDAGYPEPVVYGMISNLHAVLLQRML
jgi:hypothetical protein